MILGQQEKNETHNKAPFKIENARGTPSPNSFLFFRAVCLMLRRRVVRKDKKKLQRQDRMKSGKQNKAHILHPSKREKEDDIMS